MTEINVGLYGGKGLFNKKETPLRASVVNCEMHNECSYYKSGTCLAVLSPDSGHCKFGKVSTFNGYTSRALKYGDFKNKWKSHESYGKLQNAPRKLGIIGEYVVFPYSFITIKIENDVVKIDGPSFFDDRNKFIPINLFDVELIHRLCIFKPQALMGGTIERYRKEIVPLFLSHLKEMMPELYAKFTTVHPEYGEIDYVGRKAMLKTIAPSIVSYIPKNYPHLSSDWEWTGEHLVYKNGYIGDFNITEDYTVANLVLVPGEEATITITSNDQVKADTVFVD